MSGFVLVCGGHSAQWGRESELRRLGQLLRPRGEDPSGGQLARVERASAVGVRHPWEASLDSGPVLHSDDGLLVAADASLYYREELADRLRGLVPAGRLSAASLIAAAYRAFGNDCVEYLEGDFAFALFDAPRRRLLAARDPFGIRSLFHWRGPGGVVVASLPDPIRVVAGDPPLDRRDILRSLTLFHGDGSGSPWKGIRELPGGWSLEWRGEGEVSARRTWYPTTRREWSGGGVSEGGAILRQVLGDATAERMGPGRTAVGMSGGRDSTAMVGTVEHRRRQEPELPPLTVLTFQYPEGDPGNEDEFVREIDDALGLDLHWLDTEGMPLLEGPAGEGAGRTRPEPQPFEGQNRALASAAREAGARVILNGNGGDNLFGVGDAWMADLFRTGRWFRLVGELREKGYRNLRQMAQVCVRPALPLGFLDGAEMVLGRRILSRPWESRGAPWLKEGILEREGIIQEDRESYRKEIASRTDSVTERIRLWAFLFSGFNRNSSALFDINMDEGVEVRMPFYDRRVADFAWSRPPADLNHRGEQKVVLRHAMEGILPDRVIAPRSRRTGTSDGYFRRAVQREFPAYARSAVRGSRLAELGLVDPEAFSRAVDRWCDGDLTDELFLFIGVCVEFWLRAQDAVTPWEGGTTLHSGAPEPAVTTAAAPPRG